MRTNENDTSDAIFSRTAVLFAANLVAVGVYLIAASFGWVEREVADIPGASGGGAVVWFFLAVPVLILSFIVNFSCVIRALIHRCRTGTHYFFWAAWIALPGLWASAVAYDFSRHGI